MAHTAMDGQLLKYGIIKGVEHAGVPCGVVTGTVFDTAGGCFVSAVAASGLMRISVAGDTKIFGFADTSSHTSVAGESISVIPFTSPVVYRIPIISGTMSQAVVGDRCDLVVSGTVQGAAIGTDSGHHFIIVGGDIENNLWVDVIANPAVIGSNA
jgi:hypothetical protein